MVPQKDTKQDEYAKNLEKHLPKMNTQKQNNYIVHTVFLEYFNIKNKHFLILPFSLSRNSSAPKTKSIFQML